MEVTPYVQNPPPTPSPPMYLATIPSLGRFLSMMLKSAGRSFLTQTPPALIWSPETWARKRGLCKMSELVLQSGQLFRKKHRDRYGDIQSLFGDLNRWLCVPNQIQDVLQAIKAPKVIFQKGQAVSIHKPWAYLPPMLPTASSKICLLDTPPKCLINPGGDGEDDVSSRIKKMSRPLGGIDEEEDSLKYLTL